MDTTGGMVAMPPSRIPDATIPGLPPAPKNPSGPVDTGDPEEPLLPRALNKGFNGLFGSGSLRTFTVLLNKNNNNYYFLLIKYTVE